MEVSLNFEIAVYLSWILGVGLFLLVIQFLPARWHALEAIRLERPGREVLWALAAVVLLVGISVATDNLFGTWTRHPSFGRLVYFGQLLLVYSPIFALLLWRRQGLKTCFLRFDKLPVKILLGIGVALIASFIFPASARTGRSFPGIPDNSWEGRRGRNASNVHGRFRHRIPALPLGRMDRYWLVIRRCRPLIHGGAYTELYQRSVSPFAARRTPGSAGACRYCRVDPGWRVEEPGHYCVRRLALVHQSRLGLYLNRIRR